MGRKQNCCRIAIYTALLTGSLLMVSLYGCATGQRSSRLNVPKNGPLEQTTTANVEPEINTIYGMARLLKSQGKLQQSEIVLRRILAEHPDYIAAYIDLADIYMREGRIDMAARELEVGIGHAPQNPMLHNNLGICQLFLGNYDAAIQAFELASDQAPRDDRYRSNKALALGLAGRDEDSLNLYRQFLIPDDAYHNLRIIREIRQRRRSIHDVISPQDFIDSVPSDHVSNL